MTPSPPPTERAPSENPDWMLGLIDSAWFGSEFEGQPGREQARRIGFDSLDLFIAFDPGRMSKAERGAYVEGAKSVGLPVVSLVCTCLGLNDFNPSIRDYHIERAKSVVDLAPAFPSVRNLCFVPGEYMFQQKLLPPKLEWDRVVDATQQVGRHAAGTGWNSRSSCCRSSSPSSSRWTRWSASSTKSGSTTSRRR